MSWTALHLWSQRLMGNVRCERSDPPRLAEQLEMPGPATSLGGLHLAQIGQAAKESDPITIHVIEETADYLARGVVGLLGNFDQEIVILSAPVVRHCPTLLDAAQAHLQRIVAARSFDIPPVPARQERDAGVLAASAIVYLRYSRVYLIARWRACPKSHRSRSLSLGLNRPPK